MERLRRVFFHPFPPLRALRVGEVARAKRATEGAGTLQSDTSDMLFSVRSIVDVRRSTAPRLS